MKFLFAELARPYTLVAGVFAHYCALAPRKATRNGQVHAHGSTVAGPGSIA